jgi:hypothetical protein
MALLKVMSTPLGIDATYHSIVLVTVDGSAKMIEDVVVGSFVDKDARRAGHAQLKSERIPMNIPYVDGVISIAACYAKLKESRPQTHMELVELVDVPDSPLIETNFYADAEDC